MEKEILEKYKEAGKIAARVREESKMVIKVGANILEIAEWIEKRIKELGGEIAFPPNISINNIAAHFTPNKNENIFINEDDVIKIDIGVHVDGYIGDTAYTICFGNYSDLLKASEEALKEAIKIISPGTKIKDIGEVIERTINNYGFKPVKNLTGHGLERFNIHAEPQILNVKNDNENELKEGSIIAIEPFASNGEGFVIDSDDVRIFSVIKSIEEARIRNSDARYIFDFGLKRNGLPFAKRWLNLSEIKFRIAAKELLSKEILYPYPILFEKKDCKISQFEHTIIVLDKPIVTTLSSE
jgi:methionyl aminopeptidase